MNDYDKLNELLADPYQHYDKNGNPTREPIDEIPTKTLYGDVWILFDNPRKQSY